MRLQCAKAVVPLDHRTSRGATITLNLSRRPATDARRRVGSLFVNPGGPGAPSSQFIGTFAEVVGPEVTERFDLVGIDPRGVGGFAPLTCRGLAAEPTGGTALAYPITTDQIRRHLGYDAYLRTSCARTQAPITAFMTTAESAMDMDLIRQALGDKTLTYYGLSYGSYLGMTYASLFPAKVRAVVSTGWSTRSPGPPVPRRAGRARR